MEIKFLLFNEMSQSVRGVSKKTEKRLASALANRHVESLVDQEEENRQLLNDGRGNEKKIGFLLQKMKMLSEMQYLW